MHLNNPSVYMRMRGHPPTVILECAVCPTLFQAKDGVAFPATSEDGQMVMAAFCCHAAISRPCPPRSFGGREAVGRKNDKHRRSQTRRGFDEN
jgi:hypothetical protein